MRVGYCVLCDSFKPIDKLEVATYIDPDERVADPNNEVKVYVCKDGCK